MPVKSYKPFSLEIEDRRYEAVWHVAVGMVHVTSAQGSRSAPVGPKPEQQAHSLFRALIEAQRR